MCVEPDKNILERFFAQKYSYNDWSNGTNQIIVYDTLYGQTFHLYSMELFDVKSTFGLE